MHPCTITAFVSLTMSSEKGWRVLIAVLSILRVFVVSAQEEIQVLGRNQFPTGFVFGTASAAYQFEGAAHEGGKGISVWDVFSHIPGNIADNSTGDIAVDQYHRYKEDVKLMKEMGMDAYRFSISWPRILPNATVEGGINKVGVLYYNNLINELLKNGIKPYVTLFHWDLPQILQDKYGGFLSKDIVPDFEAFAGVCFREFGDRVKHWITLNEPWTYSASGYDTGSMPPGHTEKAATEPYIVSHNLLLAHAAAVRLYKRKFQPIQKGLIGITLVAQWYLPYSRSAADQEAAQRMMDFSFGWYMDPIAEGSYPSSMVKLVGKRLPEFSAEEKAMLKGSFDFLGLNYYTSFYAIDVPTPPNPNTTRYSLDYQVNITAERNGQLIGIPAASSWLHVYPRGIGKLLEYIKDKYKNPIIFITENGIDEANNATLSLAQSLNDTWRIDYHSKHLAFVERAIRHGSKIQGYFAWSFSDNFEWASGYTVRFGFYFIDFKHKLTRYPKASVHWFKKFLS